MFLRLSRLGLLILTILPALPAAAQDGGFAEAYAAFQSESYETALPLLRPLADGGDRRAQFLLGHLYLNGLAVTADSDRAARWFARAAAPPTPDRYALFNLGVLYERGDGVPEDLERARDFYQAAADRGVPAAMANLAALLARGDGGDRDLVGALGLFHRAMAAGHPGLRRRSTASPVRSRTTRRLPAAGRSSATAPRPTIRPWPPPPTRSSPCSAGRWTWVVASCAWAQGAATPRCS